jgi:transaldolase
MNKSPLLVLESLGQSIWLDYLRRNSLTNGEFRDWIGKDGVSGLTSNPSIFEKAITGSHDYDGAIHDLVRQGKNTQEIYQALTVEDIRVAADLFRPSYDKSNGTDGFVSLEVSPGLAHNTGSSIAEARQLWSAVSRPNLFIKIPATTEGLPAIRQLIGEGVNVNITLLFGLQRYKEVAAAYLSGLETLASNGKPLNAVASVASFFLSRIDVLVDPILDKLIQAGGNGARIAEGLHGQIAIASAKIAYRTHEEIFAGDRFKELSKKGARHQRLLWASTGTKNPAYSDVKYIEPLIGKETINTIPIETLNAYRDHGKPALSLAEGILDAQRLLDGLGQVGIDLDAVTQQLEDEGVEKFNKAYDQLMAALSPQTIRRDP